MLTEDSVDILLVIKKLTGLRKTYATIKIDIIVDRKESSDVAIEALDEVSTNDLTKMSGKQMMRNGTELKGTGTYN